MKTRPYLLVAGILVTILGCASQKNREPVDLNVPIPYPLTAEERLEIVAEFNARAAEAEQLAAEATNEEDRAWQNGNANAYHVAANFLLRYHAPIAPYPPPPNPRRTR